VQLYPNLTFDAQCEAAFKFYEECLHGRTVFMMTCKTRALSTLACFQAGPWAPARVTNLKERMVGRGAWRLCRLTGQLRSDRGEVSGFATLPELSDVVLR